MTFNPYSFAFVPAAMICAFAVSACSESAPKTRTEVVRSAAELLSGVRDKAAADAAAEKYAKLVGSLTSFGKTDETGLKDAEAAVSALLAQAVRLQKENYYESEALKKALAVSAGQQ